MGAQRSNSLLELVDDGTSLELLNETDSGVEKQQSADDTEVDPVFETSSQDSSRL